MLTLTNINDNYIKVESEILTTVLENPEGYDSINVEVTKNCCTTEVYDEEIDLLDSVSNDCTGNCDGQYAWKLDLTNIANQDKNITALYVKNVISGKVYEIMDGAIVDFGSYITSCPNGTCTIQSLNPEYEDIFKEIFDDWFIPNVQWEDISVGFCDNTLVICNLPENFVPLYIEYGTGPVKETAYFTFNTNQSLIILNEGLYIQPEFLEQEVLEDGVYKVKIRIKRSNGSWIEEEGCSFIDIDTRCKVARFIEDILKKGEDATNVHIAHYGLVNGSNCGCNCKELCGLYKYLLSLIGEIKTDKNCGC